MASLSQILLLVSIPLALALPPSYPSTFPHHPVEPLPPNITPQHHHLYNHTTKANTTHPHPVFTAVPLDFSNHTIASALRTGITAGQKLAGKSCTTSSDDPYISSSPMSHASIPFPPTITVAPHVALPSQATNHPPSTLAFSSFAFPPSAVPRSEGGVAIGRRHPQVDGASTQILPETTSPEALQGIGMSDPEISQAYALGVKMGQLMGCTPMLPHLRNASASGWKTVDDPSGREARILNDRSASGEEVAKRYTVCYTQQPRVHGHVEHVFKYCIDYNDNQRGRRRYAYDTNDEEKRFQDVDRRGQDTDKVDELQSRSRHHSAAYGIRPPHSLSWVYFFILSLFLVFALCGPITAVESIPSALHTSISRTVNNYPTTRSPPNNAQTKNAHKSDNNKCGNHRFKCALARRLTERSGQPHPVFYSSIVPPPGSVLTDLSPYVKRLVQQRSAPGLNAAAAAAASSAGSQHEKPSGTSLYFLLSFPMLMSMGGITSLPPLSSSSLQAPSSSHLGLKEKSEPILNIDINVLQAYNPFALFLLILSLLPHPALAHSHTSVSLSCQQKRNRSWYKSTKPSKVEWIITKVILGIVGLAALSDLLGRELRERAL